MKRGAHWTVGLIVFLGVTVLASALALGGAFAAHDESQGKTSQGGSMNGWRLAEPVTYENLTVFPIIAKSSADTAAFLTLDEGLASGDVVVSERGSDVLRRTRDGRPAPRAYSQGASVSELVLVNRGKKPLLLLAGEVVTGGKQDRVIAKDRIVPPGADPLPLDVFCVEHGRWSAGANFTAANMMAHPSVREKAAVDNQQDKVWEAVRAGSTSSEARAANAQIARGETPAARPAIPMTVMDTVTVEEGGTGSYARLRKNPNIGGSVETFASEVERRFAKATKGETVVGVVIAYGGEMAWADAFASPQLFAGYWPKLLRSYSVEALARPKSAEKATLDDAREFLTPLNGRQTTESEPGVYVWRQVTEGRYAAIELEALDPRQVVLHWVKIQRTT